MPLVNLSPDLREHRMSNKLTGIGAWPRARHGQGRRIHFM
jgi:hypothetical protein